MSSSNIYESRSSSHHRRLINLLPGMPAEVRDNFNYDAEALWSLTNQKIAEDICVKLVELVGPGATITDAMASVGGNTIAFAKHFKQVNAVEIHEGRHEMLRSNLALCGIKNVYVYGYAYQSLMGYLKQDVIFIDPPWGGVNYKAKQKMRIQIPGEAESQCPLEDFILQVIKSCRVKYLVLKLPRNYDFDAIAELGTKLKIVYDIEYRRPNSMRLLFLRVRC